MATTILTPTINTLFVNLGVLRQHLNNAQEQVKGLLTLLDRHLIVAALGDAQVTFFHIESEAAQATCAIDQLLQHLEGGQR